MLWFSILGEGGKGKMNQDLDWKRTVFLSTVGWEVTYPNRCVFDIGVCDSGELYKTRKWSSTHHNPKLVGHFLCSCGHALKYCC